MTHFKIQINLILYISIKYFKLYIIYKYINLFLKKIQSNKFSFGIKPNNIWKEWLSKSWTITDVWYILYPWRWTQPKRAAVLLYRMIHLDKKNQNNIFFEKLNLV